MLAPMAVVLRTSLATENVQLRAERAVFFGDAHCILHLAENLRLADDHRIKSAGDTEGMTNCVRLIVGIEIWRQIGTVDLVIARQPVDDQFRRFGRTIDFGTVAGGENRHLLDRLTVRQISQRAMQFFGIERHALANGERRRVMVDAEGKNHRIGLDRTKWGAIISPAPSPFPRSGSEQKCLLFGR